MRPPIERTHAIRLAGALLIAALGAAPAVQAAPTSSDASKAAPTAPPGVAPAAPAPAASGDGGFFGQLQLGSGKEPIVIGANQLDFDYQKNRVTYRGKVHAVQGDLAIDSDTLTITLDRTDQDKQPVMREVIAQGNVVITQNNRTATGTTAVYSSQQRQMVLLGDPVLRDGPNEVSGDRIVVYLDEGRSVVESSPKKRVSAVLYPGTGDGGLGSGPTAAGGPGKPEAKEKDKTAPKTAAKTAATAKPETAGVPE